MIRLSFALAFLLACAGPAVAADDDAPPQAQDKSSAGKGDKVPEVEQAEKGRTPDEKTKTGPEESTKGRVFEMRTYYANEGKGEGMHKRFRDHTCELFKKHGMDLIGFWTPREDKDGKGDTLIYILAFPSKEAAEKSWKGFQNDPEWIKVRDESEKNGKLVKKVVSVYLNPTDYSPVK